MLIRCGLLVMFAELREFFIWVWFITLILENLFVVFLFLEGAWSDTLNFCIHWLLRRCPLWTTWGSGTSIVPLFTWGYHSRSLRASLLFPWIHSISFTWVCFFSWGSDPSSLGALGSACLAYPWRYLERFLSALRALPCAIYRISPSWYDHIWRDMSISQQTAWYGTSCLVQDGLLTLFVAFTLEELLGLLKALVELSRIYLTTIEISSNH